MDLNVAGGADGTPDAVVSMLAQGSCAEARKIARGSESRLPAFYGAAAAACLAAFNGRSDLWAYAEAVAARPTRQEDCYDRVVAGLLRTLVKIHRQDPTLQLRRKASTAADIFPCPRILEVIPDHGPPEGGYPVRIVGVQLPPVVTIHFVQYVDFEQRDTLITARTSGGTEAIITVPRRRPGTDGRATIYPEDWPLGPTNTPLFEYDQPATTKSTTPPVASPSASRSPTSGD